jgi:hypothetical protein
LLPRRCDVDLDHEPSPTGKGDALRLGTHEAGSPTRVAVIWFAF